MVKNTVSDVFLLRSVYRPNLRNRKTQTSFFKRAKIEKGLLSRSNPYLRHRFIFSKGLRKARKLNWLPRPVPLYLHRHQARPEPGHKHLYPVKEKAQERIKRLSGTLNFSHDVPFRRHPSKAGLQPAPFYCPALHPVVTGVIQPRSLFQRPQCRNCAALLVWYKCTGYFSKIKIKSEKSLHNLP